jgi:Tfp pilus assembly PilM family ATPase
MRFASKNKGFFVEQNEHSVLLARTSTPLAPLVIEQFSECTVGDASALEEAIRKIFPKKTSSNFLNARCGVYPPRRLVRRASLEIKRLKEPSYFAEVLSSQFRTELDKYAVHVLNPVDGLDFDLKAAQKEALFCGMLYEDINSTQDALLASGIYPDSLELGSVAAMGGVVDYLKFRNSSTPTLVLEIGAETTHSFIVSSGGVEASRPIPQGFESMIPIVQSELGLKDIESARKLFLTNAFDFTGMGRTLVKRLLKELQSSIGFYEVQTGQSVGQVLCTSIPPKLSWLEATIGSALGVSTLVVDLPAWLRSREITISEQSGAVALDARWLGLVSLIASYSNQNAVTAQKIA